MSYNSSLTSTPSCPTYDICTSTIPSTTPTTKLGVSVNDNEVGGYIDAPRSGLSAGQSADVCRVRGFLSDLRGTWQDARVGFQYVMANASGVSVEFPAAASASCSYNLKETDQYVQGLVQAKNIILILDVSNVNAYSAARLAMTKTAAKQLIDSLKFNDYVSVVTYGLTASSYSGSLLAASSATKTSLKAYIDALVLTDTTVSMIDGIEAAYSIQNSSAKLNISAPCSGYFWVMLTSGENQVDIYGPHQFLNKLGAADKPVVMSFVISPTNSDPPFLIPGIVAC